MAELDAYKVASRPPSSTNGDSGAMSTLLHGQRGLNGHAQGRLPPEASASCATTSSQRTIASSLEAGVTEDAAVSYPPLVDDVRPPFPMDRQGRVEEAAELAHSQSESLVQTRDPSNEEPLSPSKAAAQADDSVSSRSFLGTTASTQEGDMPQVLKGPYTERELTRPQLRVTASASHTDDDIPGGILKSPALIPAASTESVNSSNRPRELAQEAASPLLQPQSVQKAPHLPIDSNLPSSQPAERAPDSAAGTGLVHDDATLTSRDDSITGMSISDGLARGVVSPLMEASMPSGPGLPPKGPTQGGLGLSEWARDHPSASDPAFHGKWPMTL